MPRQLWPGLMQAPDQSINITLRTTPTITRADDGAKSNPAWRINASERSFITNTNAGDWSWTKIDLIDQCQMSLRPFMRPVLPV